MGVTDSDCIMFTHKLPLQQLIISERVNHIPPKWALNLKTDLDLFLTCWLSGRAENPKICVKYLKFTGGCETTGTCENTGVTYTTGYTVVETFTKGIYDDCSYSSCTSVHLNSGSWCVFSRYQTYEDCDLLNIGGLGDVRTERFKSEIEGNRIILSFHKHMKGLLKKKLEIILR